MTGCTCTSSRRCVDCMGLATVGLDELFGPEPDVDESDLDEPCLRPECSEVVSAACARLGSIFCQRCRFRSR